MAGKSTLNRLELSRPEPTRYHKISHDAAMIEGLLVDLFLEAHRSPPKQIVLDLDATDDPLHGHQEGRFFHGYYDCYCYLPLYVFCGRHLLAAKLRKADIDASSGAVEEIARTVAQLRASWPNVRILLRANSGFAREALMAWCEANRVDYLFGLARNARLAAMIETELAAAKSAAEASGKPARRFKEFPWSTLDSWSRERRVVAKAEWTQGEANPRFVVTWLKPEEAGARHLSACIRSRCGIVSKYFDRSGDYRGDYGDTPSFTLRGDVGRMTRAPRTEDWLRNRAAASPSPAGPIASRPASGHATVAACFSPTRSGGRGTMPKGVRKDARPYGRAMAWWRGRAPDPDHGSLRPTANAISAKQLLP